MIGVDSRVRAISSERGAFSDVHFRVTGDSLLRPAGGRLRYRRPLADKGAPIEDIDLAKPRPALDHQAMAFGENLRHM
jgi:hypothetical protein